MIVRRLLSRTTVTVLALTLAAGTVLPATAAAQGEPRKPAGVAVGEPTQIGSTADTSQCLTYVAAEEVPMAVMMGCNPAPTSEVQKWVYTKHKHLMVALSKTVGGPVAKTGACLDTAADLVEVPEKATILVLPCADRPGQHWTYDKAKGTFVNEANGQALSSMLGLRTQAQPVGVEPVTGSAAQTWEQLPVPDLDLIGAIKALLNAILSALGLSLPLPIEKAAHDLVAQVGKVLPVPDQMQVLPKQILDSVR